MNVMNNKRLVKAMRGSNNVYYIKPFFNAILCFRMQTKIVENSNQMPLDIYS